MDRTDKYASDRATLRSSTKQEAMRRLWDMAREALAVRANMGVRELRYKTDLIPGVDDCRVCATEFKVVITLIGVDWGHDKGGQQGQAYDRLRYVVDEAWLLGVATPPGA